MKILALDIATKTGWKTETASGVWDLKPNRGESEGMRVVRFKSKVREIIDLEGIQIVSYERPAGLHKSSIIVASEMIGVLKDLCIEMGIELACYSATEIKKFATGKGNANKDKMIEAAKAYGYHPQDDNEADAIFLYLLTKKRLEFMSLKSDYEKIVTKYVDDFCSKQSVNFVEWIDDMGGLCVVGEYVLQFLDIKTDLDLVVPKGEIFKWYEKQLEANQMALPTMRYDMYIRLNRENKATEERSLSFKGVTPSKGNNSSDAKNNDDDDNS